MKTCRPYVAIIIFVVLFKVVKCEESTPMGHGLELGAHRPSDGHIEVLTEIPTPEVFWEKYARDRTPVLFRGVAKSFPSFKLWSDEYLRENFGELEVKLEAKMEKGDTPTGDRGLGRDTIRGFLNVYRTKNSYVVSQLPDPMAKHVNVLSCLSCGSFKRRILEANLWISGGGTSSLLHRDADNAINCLLNGTKDWILIHPKHEKNIPIAEGDTGYGGFAVLDVNKVNIVKYPNFKKVPWHYANITAGDCLYLPYGYWHQVRSYGSKNMAVSVLFSRLKEFNSTGCNGTYETVPLSDVGMVWTYTGHGLQTLGNTDPFEFRDNLVDLVKEIQSEGEQIDSSTILDQLNDADLLDETDKKLRPQVAETVYNSLYNFTDGDISESSIKELTTEQLKTLVSQIENHAPNSDDYEYAVFSPEDISKMVNKAMKLDKGKLKESTLIKQHTLRQGSEKVAQEIFNEMDLNEDGVVDKDEMDATLDDVLNMFDAEIPDSNESHDNYERELQKDKEMMGTAEDIRDEL